MFNTTAITISILILVILIIGVIYVINPGNKEKYMSNKKIQGKIRNIF